MSIQKEGPIFENVLGKELSTFTQVSKFILMTFDEIETIKNTIDSTPQSFTETKKLSVFCDRIMKIRQDIKDFIKTKKLIISKDNDDDFYISGEDFRKYEKEYGKEKVGNFTPKELFHLKYGDKLSDDFLEKMNCYMSIPVDKFNDVEDIKIPSEQDINDMLFDEKSVNHHFVVSGLIKDEVCPEKDSNQEKEK